ncbi:MAG: SprB repeat-containing protein [Draconibacterium sp.]|nr:SprB repeat-containing protein [Draconibacterium sp.]
MGQKRFYFGFGYRFAAGLHTITITDDKGCVTTASVTIDEPAVLSASAAKDSPVVCNGESNGGATVTVSVETVLILTFGTKVLQLCFGYDLAAGLHTITITDDKGCVTTASVTIGEPAVLSASAAQDSPVVCFGESNGAATVTVSGGNAPYLQLGQKRFGFGFS